MSLRKFISGILGAVFILAAIPVSAQPHESSVTAGPIDPGAGSFSVTAKFPADTDADAVFFPVWCAADQSDIVWHPATLENGCWSAVIRLSDHGWRSGPYTVHCYADLKDGSRVLAGGTAVAIPSAVHTLQVLKLGTQQPIVILRFTDSDLSQDAPVTFYITGEDGTRTGPFAAAPGSGGWVAAVPAYMLGVQGNCTAAAYIGQDSSPAATANLQLENSRPGMVRITSTDPAAGTFSMRVSAGSPANISKMRAAIWMQPDQGDIRWIEMDTDGSDWIWTADVRDYDYAFGVYNVHIYALLKNGEQQFVDHTAVNLQPHNYLYGTAENGVYRVHLAGPSVTSLPLRAAVWSAVYGGDDKKWYDMTQQPDGSWEVLVNPQNHPDGRTLEISVYSGNVLLSSLSYPEMEATVGYTSAAAEGRLQKNAEAVYAAVGRDLHEVYKYVRDNITYKSRAGHIIPPEGYTREEWYAIEGFETFQGNCYTYASTFCELAQRLGYEAQYIEGQVPSTSGWIGHGFVIVTIDGKKYICDAVFEHSSTSGRNYYMQPIEKPRTTYRW